MLTLNGTASRRSVPLVTERLCASFGAGGQGLLERRGLKTEQNTRIYGQF